MKALLIVISVIGLTAVIGAIVIGTRTFDGTVTPDPYEKGLAWDRERKEREAADLNVRTVIASPHIGHNRLRVTVTDKAAHGVTAEVRVAVSRPATNHYDRVYPMEHAGEGNYLTDVELPLLGYWELTVTVSAGGSSTTYLSTVFAEQRTAP